MISLSAEAPINTVSLLKFDRLNCDCLTGNLQMFSYIKTVLSISIYNIA